MNKLTVNITDCLIPQEITSINKLSACYVFFFYSNPTKAILEIVNINFIYKLILYIFSYNFIKLVFSFGNNCIQFTSHCIIMA